MKFIGTVATDIGTTKNTNQDSVCLKIANTRSHGQVAMVVVCDGMGGLEKGELASATVIRTFAEWFDEVFPHRLGNFTWNNLAEEWVRLVKSQNYKILEYGKRIGVNLGTTFTAMLVIDKKYMIVHVGDSRVYKITKQIEQLTEDHTFIAREIKRGAMTPEQAAVDSRRNMLLQCVGASKVVEPQVIYGDVNPNEVYLICSDGFRHAITSDEIRNSLSPAKIKDANAANQTLNSLIETIKIRKERDNISAAFLKCLK